MLSDALLDFPSPYVHAGGDEVPRPPRPPSRSSPAQLERHLAARGRRLVGWDEIFTPQLSPRAVVMVWTARDRAASAARHGNDVVVASGAFYFDGAQGDVAQEPRASPHMSTLEEVYDAVVTPAGLGPREAAHVLGGQANLWTERITTPEHLFYMALPRELALAEVLWTPRARKSWDGFLARLPAQLAWLDAHDYRFRIPNTAFALSGGPAAFEAVPGRVQAVDAWTSAPAVTVRSPCRWRTPSSATRATARRRRRCRRPTAGRSPCGRAARRSGCGRRRSCTAGPARSASARSCAARPRRCARTAARRRRGARSSRRSAPACRGQLRPRASWIAVRAAIRNSISSTTISESRCSTAEEGASIARPARPAC